MGLRHILAKTNVFSFLFVFLTDEKLDIKIHASHTCAHRTPASIGTCATLALHQGLGEFFPRCLLLMLRCGMWIVTPSRHGCLRFPQCWQKTDQSLGLHQTRLDKHDAELDSQRLLLEDLETEVSLLRKNSSDCGRMGCDMSSDSPHRVCLCEAGRRLALRPSQKIDRRESKNLSDALLSMLQTCLQNNVVVRSPFAANCQISLGIKGGGGWDSYREFRVALVAGIEAQMFDARGETQKVSTELSPLRLSNIVQRRVLPEENWSEP